MAADYKTAALALQAAVEGVVTTNPSTKAFDDNCALWSGEFADFQSSSYVAPFAGINFLGSSVDGGVVDESSYEERLTFEVIVVGQDHEGRGASIQESLSYLVLLRNALSGTILKDSGNVSILSPLRFEGVEKDREYEFAGASVWRLKFSAAWIGS